VPTGLAVGKTADALEISFSVHDDGSPERAAIIGLAAGLRAAPTDLSVVLTVDTPLVTAPLLLELAAACLDAAVPQTGPLPAASAPFPRSSPANGRFGERSSGSMSPSWSSTRRGSRT
jgi:hypothetical protein